MSVAAVLSVAQACRWMREEPRNSNRGQVVDALNAVTGAPMGSPWCASWVAWVGTAVMGKQWPLPKTAGCAALGAWAAKAGTLRDTPVAGDVFLIYHANLSRFAHTGFVVSVGADGKCVTIEGNTNDGGSRDGWGVFQRTRTFGPRDRFIRWAA